MQQLVCKKCGYAWQYAGNKHRTSCSKCKTSITVVHQQTAASQPKLEPTAYIEKMIEQDSNKTKPQSVKFPLSLWRDVRFKQRIDHAPSLGEDHIVLKVDNDGILFL
jgi:hypothetical protein